MEHTQTRGDILISREEYKNEYRKANLKRIAIIIATAVCTLMLFFITLGFGVFKISVADAISTFFNHLSGNIIDPRADRYIWEIRAPRAIGAILIGAGLSVAGVVMQNNFRNPLAEPYTMGISSGSFLGAVLSIVLGISIIPFFDGNNATVLNAFVLSLIPMLIIVIVSKSTKITPTAMILTGIAIMFMFSSVTQLILVTAPSETLASAYEWRVGSLSNLTWGHLPVMLSVTVIVCILIWLLSDKLNVMYSGDRSAQTLGEIAKNVRIVTLILVSLMTAALVCYTGPIGFIGLVGPHVARIFVGSNNRYLIPASATIGACFVLFADTIAKISGPNGLPVGVICSMIGGPVFIWILIRQRKNAWA